MTNTIHNRIIFHPLQSCDYDLSRGRLCTGETADGNYARKIEWWWIRTKFIVYVSGIARKQAESIMGNILEATQEKYAATNVFHATCKKEKTTESTLGSGARFPHQQVHGFCDLGLRILILTPSMARLT